MCFSISQGGGINFSRLQKSPIYPLKYGNVAKGTSNSTDAGRYIIHIMYLYGTFLTLIVVYFLITNYIIWHFRNCIPDELDGRKVKGSIILCSNNDDNYFFLDKTYKIKELGGLGAIFIDDDKRVVPFNTVDFPVTSVTSKDGLVIISYISSIR